MAPLQSNPAHPAHDGFCECCCANKIVRNLKVTRNNRMITVCAECSQWLTDTVLAMPPALAPLAR